MDPLYTADVHLSEQHHDHADTSHALPVAATHSSVEWNPAASTSEIMEIVNYQPTALQVSRADQFAHKCLSGLSVGRRGSFGKRDAFDSIQSAPYVPTSFCQTAPPQRWVSPSITRGLQIKFTEQDATFLDMRSCVSEIPILVHKLTLGYFSRLWLLPRLPKLGLQFRREKLDAFLRGDESGTIVNRGLVAWAHALGMVFSDDIAVTPTMIRFYARRNQVAWECLAEILNRRDWLTAIRSLMVAGSGSILVCMWQTALLYIQKSCEVIKAGNLRFIPARGNLPEFSEELHETLVPLTQTIYWANYLFLMRGGPEPRGTANIEREFRQELPVSVIAIPLVRRADSLRQGAYPILFEICPLVIRTRGILLVRDAILLLSALPDDGKRYVSTSSVGSG